MSIDIWNKKGKQFRYGAFLRKKKEEKNADTQFDIALVMAISRRMKTNMEKYALDAAKMCHSGPARP